jgi:hypothetical protein
MNLYPTPIIAPSAFSSLRMVLAEWGAEITCSESVLATATSGACGAETSVNTTPSTTGMLGPEYLPGAVGDSVADNLTDDQRDGAH